AGTDTRQVLGVPVIQGALAWSVCLVEDVRRYGDHDLVVGRVAAVHVGGGRPLLWHERRFRGVTECEPGPEPGSASGREADAVSTSEEVPVPMSVPVPVPVPVPVSGSGSVPVPVPVSMSVPDGPG